MNSLLKIKSFHGKVAHLLETGSDLRRYYVWNATMKHRAQGCEKLTQEQDAVIDRLYAPYKKISHCGHQFYTDRTGAFSENYIPDSIWYAYIDPFYNPRSLAKALDSKVLYDRLLMGGGKSKHPQSLAYRINGFWVSGDFKPTTIEEIAEVAMDCPVVFIKQAEDSAGGHGVIYYDCADGKGKLIDLLHSLRANVVIQKGIVQHSILNRLNSSSVNTVRVLSHLTQEAKIIVRSVIVRMGRNGAHVDNASSGGITVGVDADGRLKSTAFDTQGNRYDQHPDSHTKFPDITLPNYDNIISEVKALHWQLPQFRLLSWDMAIDADATPTVIEVNMHSGQLDFHQLNNGPVFGNDTKSVLEEVFHHNVK